MTMTFKTESEFEKALINILDFFHNPSNNPKTTIKINQSTDQTKA